MRLVIASDHGGFKAKEEVKKHLLNEGHEVLDVGCFSEDSCNYAEFGIEAAKKVASKEVEFGILICSSGEGISIAANKIKGVRCGIGYNDEVAKLLRLHNDANMISFGAKFMSKEDMIRRTELFINTEFEGGRHEVRVATIKSVE